MSWPWPCSHTRPPVFRSRSVPRMAPSFSSLTFSLRGEGRLPCRAVRVPGELSSCRMVRGDLPSTLPFGFRLLHLEPEDLGVSGSLKGLSEPWLATGVSEGCPVSSLESICLEGSSLWLQGGIWSSRENRVPRGKSSSEDDSVSRGRIGSGEDLTWGLPSQIHHSAVSPVGFGALRCWSSWVSVQCQG